MLVLTRRVGEVIHIGEDIKLTVVRVQGEKVRIGIEAPAGVSVFREEVYWRIREEEASENRKASGSRQIRSHDQSPSQPAGEECDPARCWGKREGGHAPLASRRGLRHIHGIQA